MTIPENSASYIIHTIITVTKDGCDAFDKKTYESTYSADLDVIRWRQTVATCFQKPLATHLKWWVKCFTPKSRYSTGVKRCFVAHRTALFFKQYNERSLHHGLGISAMSVPLRQSSVASRIRFFIQELRQWFFKLNQTYVAGYEGPDGKIIRRSFEQQVTMIKKSFRCLLHTRYLQTRRYLHTRYLHTRYPQG